VEKRWSFELSATTKTTTILRRSPVLAAYAALVFAFIYPANRRAGGLFLQSRWRRRLSATAFHT